ncbi:MAG: Ig-like domain-containing protein, partial [Lachnospiraceae bacterium]|nr:Ig-like domain-containing protein [Lachnospiraceae bacterium]
VQLQNAFDKVIVSPVQKDAPQVSANGKRVTVQLRDSLQENMTYTIDFGDAIKDLNEGNVLDGFTYSFSTGDSIDSLRISGLVLEARTLEPAQGMLVGVHSNLSDTAITTLAFDRITRTNQLGQFTIHNLKPGKYRVFALNDVNRDYKWDRSEDVAFFDTIITPYATAIEVSDTLMAHDGSDSIQSRAGTAFFPNDVLLTWFNENYQSQYMKDYSRPDRRKISLILNAPADSLPELTIASGPLAGKKADEWGLLGASSKRDSLTYWITDTAVLHTDSLFLSVRYQRTDTLEELSWTTDTLKFFFFDPKTKEKKKKKKEEEETDSTPPKPTFITFTPVTKQQQEVYLPLVFSANEPIASIDTAGVRLEALIDTTWTAVPNGGFVPDSLSPLTTRRLYSKWEPGQKYRLIVDSAAVRSVYGFWNDSIAHEFTVRPLEEYANLTFNIEGLEGRPAVVELLEKSDAVRTQAKVKNGKAVFPYQNSGDVYARLFIDSNDNGVWDTGSLADSIQPEEVYYYPKKIALKKNWDVEQAWNIYETPLDTQKPLEIKKNKPKTKKGERNGQNGDEEDEDDEFGPAGGYGPGGYGSGYGNGNHSTGNYGNYGSFGGMTQGRIR